MKLEGGTESLKKNLQLFTFFKIKIKVLKYKSGMRSKGIIEKINEISVGEYWI